MNKRTLLTGAVAAGTLVWFASPELQWPARLLAALLLGPAPLLFAFQASLADALPRPFPRIPLYVSSIIGLATMAAVTLMAGALSGLSYRMMGLKALEPRGLLVWTVFGIAAALSIVVAFKAGGARESDLMRELIPRTPAEKAVYVLLSLAAGLCEEVAFRGFLVVALTFASGSLVIGAALSAMAFGIMHAHQSPAGALRAAMIGAVLTVPVVVTGSLYPAIAAHTAIDLIGGLWIARWLFR